MKIYIKPEIEIARLDNEDIITASGGIALNNGNFKSEKGYTVIDNF